MGRILELISKANLYQLFIFLNLCLHVQKASAQAVNPFNQCAKAKFDQLNQCDPIFDLLFNVMNCYGFLAQFGDFDQDGYVDAMVIEGDRKKLRWGPEFKNYPLIEDTSHEIKFNDYNGDGQIDALVPGYQSASVIFGPKFKIRPSEDISVEDDDSAEDNETIPQLI